MGVHFVPQIPSSSLRVALIAYLSTILRVWRPLLAIGRPNVTRRLIAPHAVASFGRKLIGAIDSHKTGVINLRAPRASWLQKRPGAH